MSIDKNGNNLLLNPIDSLGNFKNMKNSQIFLGSESQEFLIP